MSSFNKDMFSFSKDIFFSESNNSPSDEIAMRNAAAPENRFLEPAWDYIKGGGVVIIMYSGFSNCACIKFVYHKS